MPNTEHNIPGGIDSVSYILVIKVLKKSCDQSMGAGVWLPGLPQFALRVS